MPDKLLYGSPPTAAENAAGALKLEVFYDGTDVNQKTIKMNIYAPQLPNTVDWGDGVRSTLTAWTTPPTAGVLGKATVTHAYALRPNMYAIYVEAAGMRVRANVMAGKLPIIDDVTRTGVERPPKTTLGDHQAEARAMLKSTRDQMKVPPVHGGYVN